MKRKFQIFWSKQTRKKAKRSANKHQRQEQKKP